MKKTLILSLCLLFCLSVPAAAAALSMPSAPDVVRPGKSYEFVLETAAEGTVSMTLEDAGGQTYTVMRDYPLQIGENVLRWDGLLPDFSPVAEGDYTLRLQMGDGQSLSAPLRVGAPYPLLSETGHVSGLDAVEVTLYASEAGTLFVRVETADGATLLEDSLPVQAGETVYAWGYAQDGQRVPAGQYLLVFQLRTANGFSSNEQYSYVEVSAPADRKRGRAGRSPGHCGHNALPDARGHAHPGAYARAPVRAVFAGGRRHVLGHASGRDGRRRHLGCSDAAHHRL